MAATTPKILILLTLLAVSAHSRRLRGDDAAHEEDGPVTGRELLGQAAPAATTGATAQFGVTVDMRTNALTTLAGAPIVDKHGNPAAPAAPAAPAEVQAAKEAYLKQAAAPAPAGPPAAEGNKDAKADDKKEEEEAEEEGDALEFINAKDEQDLDAIGDIEDFEGLSTGERRRHLLL